MLKLILPAMLVAGVAGVCQPYQSTFTFAPGQYPTIWQKPGTSVFATPEFQQLNASIDWTKVPAIPPKQMANGAFVPGYNTMSDPDCWWSASLCTTPKFSGLNPDVSICPEPNTLGLTYDDGPNCTDAQLYDVLKSNNQKVSLFYIGSNVADWPHEAARGFADGHQICVHTWSHPYMTTLTNQEVLGELYYTRKAIKYVLGVTPLCWRPPFGDVDDRVRAIAQQLSLSTIIWDQDTDDWQMVPSGTQPQNIIDGRYQSIVDRGQNGTYATHGTILLSHELNQGTISEAITWYPKLKAAYKNIVPVATCLNITQPYAEKNITYPDFASYTGSPPSTNGTPPPPSTSSMPSAAASDGVVSLFVGLLAIISALVVM